MMVCLYACGSPSETAATGSGPTAAPPPSEQTVVAATESPAAAPAHAPEPAPAVESPPSPSQRGAPDIARPLTDADLQGKSLIDLKLMRNRIFAVHGHPFHKPWLAKHFADQPWYRAGEPVVLADLPEAERANATRIGEHEMRMSRADLERLQKAVVARRAGGSERPFDAEEAKLLARRMGERTTEGDEGSWQPFGAQPHAALIPVTELDQLSRFELRLARNAIYARRGRAFKSEILQDYFAAMSWYAPRDNYAASMLSSVDLKNIGLIKSVEHSQGGPLTERESVDFWYGEA